MKTQNPKLKKLVEKLNGERDKKKEPFAERIVNEIIERR